MAHPEDNWELATALLRAGRERLGPEGKPATTLIADADQLAEALIDAGCRQLQAADMRAHGNRLPPGSLGSRAQVRGP